MDGEDDPSAKKEDESKPTEYPTFERRGGDEEAY